MRDYVNFIVGGIYYSLFLGDIRNYPESYFNIVIKKEWNPEQDSPIQINRDGKMFRYIAEFHHHGELPFKSKKVSLDLLKEIQEEGDFYNLPLLVKECEKYLVSRISESLYDSNADCEYWSDTKDNLVNITSGLWAPFFHKGFRIYQREIILHKSSSLLSLNIDELCEVAMPAPFGKGSESLIDPAVRDALEISADQLDPKLWDEFLEYKYDLHKLAPRMNLELRPYKLVIYKEGGHFIEHRDSVRGAGHVGTLVHILNSKFTGGELVVRQNETEVSISKPGEWIAMYGDALHRINPVTSGTHVALIFDLYNVGPLSREQFFSASYFRPTPAEAAHVRDELRMKIFAALDMKLNTFDDVVICLDNLYLLCQADTDCLNGGDATLYQLLVDGGYDVAMVPVKIQSYTYEHDLSLCHFVGEVTNLDVELSGDWELRRQCSKRSTLVVVPLEPTNRIHPILGGFDPLDHDGPEVAVFLVSGLRISKRCAASMNPEAKIVQSHRTTTGELTPGSLKRTVSVEVSSDTTERNVKKSTLG